MDLYDSLLTKEEAEKVYKGIRTEFAEIRFRYSRGDCPQEDVERLNKYMMDVLNLLASPVVHQEIRDAGTKLQEDIRKYLEIDEEWSR